MEKTKRNIKRIVIAVAAVLLFPAGAFAADSGIPDGYAPTPYNNIPHVQMRDVFETETVEVSGIRVNIDRYFNDENDPVHFRIFNTTTQETECEVDAENDGTGSHYLPPMDLKKGHDYIFFVEDECYRSPHGPDFPSDSKTYVQVLAGDEAAATDGPGAYNYMTLNLKYDKIGEIDVECRDSVCDDPFDENRYNASVDVCYKKIGTPVTAGVKFRLVSGLETLTAATDADSKLNVSLIEGVTYMVYVDSNRYSIDPFPIVAKDKTEYVEGLYCYNHTDCTLVGIVGYNRNPITLYDPGETEFDGYTRVTRITSLIKDRSIVSGINFKNQILLDRLSDTEVASLAGKDYEVADIVAVNPRRWEISKLAGTAFTYTRAIPKGKKVTGLYYLNDDGEPVSIAYKQTGQNIEFKMNSVSLYPIAVVYEKDDSLPIYRLYNPKTKEHLWTAAKKEYNVLPDYGWRQEGIAWCAPGQGKSVYRLYNPKTKDHHYTSNTNEVSVLTTKYGWRKDNNGKPVFCSGGSKPIYRLYNKSFKIGSHHLTTSAKEYQTLPQYGWKQEGIAMNAVK